MDKRKRLAELEAKIRAATGRSSPPRRYPCPACGEQRTLRYCSTCATALQRRQWREAQQRARARARNRRHLEAGLLKRVECPSRPGSGLLAPSLIPCRHCGEPFAAQRVTARFCSARCRVAHHRQQGD